MKYVKTTITTSFIHFRASILSKFQEYLLDHYWIKEVNNQQTDYANK